MNTLENIEYEEQYSQQKLKMTGSIIQLSKFAKRFHFGKWQYGHIKKIKDENYEPQLSDETKEDIRKRSSRRAKTKLIDWINTNVYEYHDEKGRVIPAVFLTLTFEQNETNIIYANYEFTKFIQRLNYEITGDKKPYVKYVCVIEFQKRGAVHYHIVFFNIPFVHKDKMSELWSNGHIKIKMVDDVKDIGYYVTKYMVKDIDDPRLQGRKSYFVSNGLIKPTIIHFEELINLVKRMLPEDTKEFEKNHIPAGFLLSMDYKRYNLKNYPEVQQEIKDFINRYS